MTTPLREALELIARDVPALGDLEEAIQQGRSRRRTRWIVAATGAVAAAAVVFAVWGSGTLTTAPDIPAVTPSPAANLWPATVDLGPEPQPLASSPLPSGAVLAVRLNEHLLVVAGSEQRLVATARAIGLPALSPDGKLVAYARYGFGNRSDFITVVDVTTGMTVLDENVLTSDGKGSQTWQLEWSADGRRLFQVVPLLGTAGPTDDIEIRVWELRGGSLQQVAALIEPPGPYIGVSPDGSQIAAESGNVVAMSNVAAENWVKTSTPIALPDDTAPTGDPGCFACRGQNRWSPDGRMLGWGVTFGDPSDRANEVRSVDLDSSAWSTSPVLDASSLQFVGWRDAQPVLQRMSGGEPDTVPAAPTDIVAVGPDGSLSVLTTITAWFGSIGGVSVAQDRLP